jgi:UDP-N-acetylmuramoyl-L-alanyl-D-glutamate--2,6-diaminopimelate ligase
MGRLIIVFGAGGDRDRTKRPLMGAAARGQCRCALCHRRQPPFRRPGGDPRRHPAACPEANEVGDRAEAILRAVDALLPGDALLIAGKGHETGQVIGPTSSPSTMWNRPASPSPPWTV